MTTRDKILAELARQETHEGTTDNIKQCRLILDHVQTRNEWSALVSVGWHRYGPLSYECHRFYYVRPWVIPFCKSLAETAPA